MSSAAPEPVAEHTVEVGPVRSPVETTRRLIWPGGLSARLLVLTFRFVAVAELLILAPSLASFEAQWLTDRVRRGEMASLPYEQAPDLAVSGAMREELRRGSGLVGLALTTRNPAALRTELFRPEGLAAPYEV